MRVLPSLFFLGFTVRARSAWSAVNLSSDRMEIPRHTYCGYTLFTGVCADASGNPREGISRLKVFQCFFGTISLDQGIDLLDRVACGTIGLAWRRSRLIGQPIRKSDFSLYFFTEFRWHR